MHLFIILIAHLRPPSACYRTQLINAAQILLFILILLDSLPEHVEIGSESILRLLLRILVLGIFHLEG